MLPAILLSLSSRNFFILIQFSWLITQGVLPSFVLSHCIISLYRPSIMTLYHYTCHHTKPSLVPAHCSITLYCNTPLHGIVTLKIILFITLYCLHVPLHHFSRRCLCLAVYVPSPFPHERGVRRQKEDGALRVRILTRRCDLSYAGGHKIGLYIGLIFSEKKKKRNKQEWITCRNVWLTVLRCRYLFGCLSVCLCVAQFECLRDFESKKGGWFYVKKGGGEGDDEKEEK